MKWPPLTDAERERLALLSRVAYARPTFEERQERKRLIDLAARERIGREEERSRAARRPAAEQFLREALADGPRSPLELVLQAKSQGLSSYRLQSARRKLSIVSARDGAGTVVWSLPEAA
jgi:hypothetical protein